MESFVGGRSGHRCVCGHALTVSVLSRRAIATSDLVLMLLSAAAIFAVAAVDDFFIPDPKFLDASALAYALGGFFVGFGTRFGNGCTSGVWYFVKPYCIFVQNSVRRRS